MAEKKTMTAINVKMSEEDKQEIIRKAHEEMGTDNISEYMRTTALKAEVKISVRVPKKKD